MENNFDKEVKKILENLEVEYTPSDWNLMEEKIEEHSDLHPELEDALIDGIAFDSLQNLEEPFNPEHWNLMREKLDAAYAFRRKLMKYKVAEVALVALFIFTLVQFLPIKKIQPRNIAAKNSTAVFQNDHQDNTSDFSQEPPNNVNDNQINSNNANNSVSLNDQELTSTSNNIIADNSDFDSKNEKIASSHLNELIPENNSPSQTNESIINNNEKNKAEATLNTESQNAFLSEDLNINVALLNPISLKDAEKLKVASVEELSGSKIFSDLKKPIKVRVGMAIGTDANYIMTPYDQKTF